jgi:hypothetical protein
MRYTAAILASLLLTTVSATALAETPMCPEGMVCVEQADMVEITKILKEKKCLVSTQPTLKLDPITIVVDRQGRVYGSGEEPHPYKVQMTWCDYDITANGEAKLTAAEHVDPDWGFRFRPKATFGLLGTELLMAPKFTDSLDGGLLLEPFYYRWVNINGYVGIRSFGAALGFDITKNFGLAAGYAVTWGGWRSNPFAGAYFSFW